MKAGIHTLAKSGKVNQLRKVLRSEPETLEALTKRGWTPLFYAANAQQLNAVKLLFKKGARGEWVDAKQKNVVMIAKENAKHTPTSKYIKSKIGLSEEEKESFKWQFRGIVKKAYQRAITQNKKLLVLLGEAHGFYACYQIEKIFLTVLSEFNIKHFGVENVDISHANHPIDRYAKNKLKMKLHALDIESQSISKRDSAMSLNINKLNKHSVVIVGADHLRGILPLIDYEKYHVVPFSLSGAISWDISTKTKRASFSRDKQYVVQVKNRALTDATKVSDYWNKKRIT